MKKPESPGEGDIGQLVSLEFTAVALHAIERGLADSHLVTLVATLRARMDLLDGKEPRPVRKDVAVARRLKELRAELLGDAFDEISSTAFDPKVSNAKFDQRSVTKVQKASDRSARHEWVKNYYIGSKVQPPPSFRVLKRRSMRQLLGLVKSSTETIEYKGRLYNPEDLIGDYAVTSVRGSMSLSNNRICKIIGVHPPHDQNGNSILIVVVVGIADANEASGLSPSIENELTHKIDVETFGHLFAV